MYRCAIIGVSGNRARGHADAYQQIRRGQLVAVATRQPEKLNAFGDEFNVAARYTDRLAGIAGLGLPRVPQWAEPAWHLYVVRTDRRPDLMKALERAGIGSLIHYPIPPHLQQAYADLGLPKGTFPLAEALAETVLSLPMGPHLPADAVDRVAAVVRATLA